MYNLAFRTYLEGYVRSLSLCGSGRMRVLAREVESRTNSRLLEPLVVLAAVTGRLHLLEREALPGGLLEPELALMRDLGSPETLVSLLKGDREPGVAPLRPEYRKVWRSYTARALASDDGLVRYALRDRVLRARETSGESYYSMAMATGLNGGAVWDALARGNVKRLSRKSMEALATHAEAVAGRTMFLSPEEWPDLVTRYREAFAERVPRVGSVG